MKYVMVDDIKPILFSEMMQHSDFKDIGNITSAGMCRINAKLKRFDGHISTEKTVCCYGESISLKLKPAKQDEKYIKKFLLEW